MKKQIYKQKGTAVAYDNYTRLYHIKACAPASVREMKAEIMLDKYELDAIHAAIHADDEAEPVEADCCGNCFHADMIELPAGSYGEDTVESPMCRRFPKSILKDDFEWCGEYRRKE